MLVVDNGSAFTPRLAELLEKRADFDMVGYGELEAGTLGGYDTFVLSGRRSNDRRMNAANSMVISHCIAESKKLLGICYGAEMLALTLGGTIRRMPEPVSGAESVTPSAKNPLCTGPMQVHESHRYELASLGPDLVHLASSGSCRHEIVAHRDRPAYGVQFHPEMSPDGERLLDRFLDL